MVTLVSFARATLFLNGVKVGGVVDVSFERLGEALNHPSARAAYYWGRVKLAQERRRLARRRQGRS